MDDKEKVIERLLGCECDSMEDGCFIQCPDNDGMKCSRDTSHKGGHYACTYLEHKIYEW